MVLWLGSSAALIYGAFKLRYSMTNIDGISYMRIAEHWAAGRFDEAVNAYWSPMISWTMLPFMGLGADTQLAFMLASASWASVGVAAGTYFVFRQTNRNFFSALVVGVTVWVLCAGNLMNLTPDLLVIAWTMIFAWVLTEVNDRLAVGTRRSRILAGVLLGLTCVLGYLIKQFLIPVFVVVLIGWLAVRFLALRRSKRSVGTGHGRRTADDPGSGTSASGTYRQRAKPLLILPAVALLTMIVVAAPWVTALTVKYGYPTIGSSFSVNTATKLDPTAGTTTVTNSLELAPAASKNAISYGEDRTYQVPTPTSTGTTGSNGATTSDAATKKTSLVAGLKYYAGQRVKALPFYLDKIQAIAPFAVPIIAAFVILLAFGLISPRRHRAAVITATIFVVYFTGYLGLTSAAGKGGNLRYYWPLLALSTVTAALLWPALWQRVRAQGGWWRKLAAIALIVIIPVAAVSQHGYNRAYPFATGQTYGSYEYLRSTAVKPADQVFAEKLVADGVIKEGDRIVSNRVIRTLIYSWYMRAQIWGRDIPHDFTDPAFQKIIKDDKIQYFFLYEPESSTTMDVSGLGVVEHTYTMPYTCGTEAGKPAEACRLSIVRIDY